MSQQWKIALVVIASFWPSAYASAQTDSTPHKVQMVTVEPGVRLEVLDWGGSGSPLIFLAGAGDTAHRFDGFAPQFTKQHHVYGITRRGSGASGSPAPTMATGSPARLIPWNAMQMAESDGVSRFCISSIRNRAPI